MERNRLDVGWKQGEIITRIWDNCRIKWTDYIFYRMNEYRAHLFKKYIEQAWKERGNINARKEEHVSCLSVQSYFTIQKPPIVHFVLKGYYLREIYTLLLTNIAPCFHHHHHSWKAHHFQQRFMRKLLQTVTVDLDRYAL